MSGVLLYSLTVHAVRCMQLGSPSSRNSNGSIKREQILASGSIAEAARQGEALDAEDQFAEGVVPVSFRSLPSPYRVYVCTVEPR